MSNILLVETDFDIAQRLRSWFVAEGCQVDLVGSRNEALNLLLPGSYDIVILEYPGSHGFAEFYKKILDVGGNVPILVLPATGSVSRAKLTRILTEHVARLLSCASAADRAEFASASAPNKQLKVGDITLDPYHKIVMKSGCEIFLTALEFDLLESMMQSPLTVLTLDRFNNRPDSPRACASPEAFRTCIKTLRRKLGEHGRSMIHTVHGLGYKLIG